MNKIARLVFSNAPRELLIGMTSGVVVSTVAFVYWGVGVEMFWIALFCFVVALFFKKTPDYEEIKVIPHR